MPYLRFGNIPKNEKSINFLKIPFSKSEDFTFLLKNGDTEKAFSIIPDEALESGVSVFQMDENRMPVLSSLRLVTALLSRLGEPIFEVEGTEVNHGNDAEPLIQNITVLKRRRVTKEKLLDLALTTLLQNFKNATYDPNRNTRENTIFTHNVEYKINKKTGEKVSRYQHTEGNDWVKMPPYHEYTFNGWTFSDPVDTFDTSLGYRS